MIEVLEALWGNDVLCVDIVRLVASWQVNPDRRHCKSIDVTGA
jgi:hypothetical protein